MWRSALVNRDILEVHLIVDQSVLPTRNVLWIRLVLDKSVKIPVSLDLVLLQRCVVHIIIPHFVRVHQTTLAIHSADVQRF